MLALMANPPVTIGPLHPSHALLLKLFDRALGDRAHDFHGMPAWLDLTHSVDPTGWHEVHLGPYQLRFPQSQQPVDELRNAHTSAPLPPVLDLLDTRQEVAQGLLCELEWIEDYNSWMLFRKVVTSVEDARQEVSISEARKLDEAYEVNDEMAEFIAEPGELWAVLLREAFLLPEGTAPPPEIGLTDEALQAMVARAKTPDVPVLVSEIRRLRALLS